MAHARMAELISKRFIRMGGSLAKSKAFTGEFAKDSEEREELLCAERARGYPRQVFQFFCIHGPQ